MKYSNAIALLLCLAASQTDAFQGLPPTGRTGVGHRVSTSVLQAVVELEPEPEGGKELTPTTSMPGCRMKEMDELKLKSKLGTPYQFWMTAEVDPTLVKEIRTQVLKDASKKANFPGFRKGQVPPYAQPQITNFAIQEAIIKTVQAAVDAFGLKALEGSDGEVEVKEDVQEMSKGYKTGESLSFTATVNAAYDPEVALPVEEKLPDDVIEAEIMDD
eukprot:scaffold2954_cov171-Amphora_coffeaeformis.AAC.14